MPKKNKGDIDAQDMSVDQLAELIKTENSKLESATTVEVDETPEETSTP